MKFLSKSEAYYRIHGNQTYICQFDFKNYHLEVLSPNRIARLLRSTVHYDIFLCISNTYYIIQGNLNLHLLILFQNLSFPAFTQHGGIVTKQDSDIYNVQLFIIRLFYAYQTLIITYKII